jgi:hypothetical protein
MNWSEVLDIVTALGIVLLVCCVGRKLVSFWEREKLRPEPTSIRRKTRPSAAPGAIRSGAPDRS